MRHTYKKPINWTLGFSVLSVSFFGIFNISWRYLVTHLDSRSAVCRFVELPGQWKYVFPLPIRISSRTIMERKIVDNLLKCQYQRLCYFHLIGEDQKVRRNETWFKSSTSSLLPDSWTLEISTIQNMSHHAGTSNEGYLSRAMDEPEQIHVRGV